MSEILHQSQYYVHLSHISKAFPSHPFSSISSTHSPPSLSRPSNSTGRRIHRTPTRRIHTRPHNSLACDVAIMRACNNTIHDPRTPRHMRCRALGRTHRHSRRRRPRTRPNGRTRDHVFSRTRRRRSLGFFGLDGAIDLQADVSEQLTVTEDTDSKQEDELGEREPYVVYDAGVGVAVCAWEPHALRQLHIPSARHFNLHTIRIKLRTAFRVHGI